MYPVLCLPDKNIIFYKRTSNINSQKMDKKQISNDPYQHVEHYKLEDSTLGENDPQEDPYKHYNVQESNPQLNSFQKPTYPQINQNAGPYNQPMNSYPHYPNPNYGHPPANPHRTIAQSLPANHNMVQPRLPVQNLPPNYTNATFEVKEETIDLMMPHFCQEHVFKKLFPRRIPRVPLQVQCPACNHQVTTSVKHHAGIGLVGTTLGALCCFPICAWLPLCMKDCYDLHHRCPDCGYTIYQEKFLCKR